jgi:hypothetical protein
MRASGESDEVRTACRIVCATIKSRATTHVYRACKKSGEFRSKAEVSMSLRGNLLLCLLVGWLVISAAPAVGQTSTAPAVPLDDKAWQMLVDALAEAKTASPAVRAWVGLEFAKQLDQDNKKSDERNILREAYLATLEGTRPSYDTMGWVQSDILRAMLKNLGPEPVEELLPRMDEEQRALALNSLVIQYTADKNWERAMDTVRRAPTNNWFPFFPVAELMKELPAQDVAKRRELFALTYAIYKKGPNAEGALQQMIELFWRELPREQVVELIPVMLKDAMRADLMPMKLQRQKSYDITKAKLLPILRELDSAKAEQWEKNEAQTLAEVRKEGPFRVTPEQAEGPGLNPSRPSNSGAYQKPPGSPKPREVAGCLENEPWCQQNRVEHALAAVEEHLKKNEIDQAKVGINRGYWIALSQWKLDTDTVDPNQVIKTHWPSTVNWEAFSVMASRISPEYAMQKVKEIPDAEIRLLTRTMLARTWLDHPPVFPCPSLHSNYHDGGACIPYRMYMPRELFSWANNWE